MLSVKPMLSCVNPKTFLVDYLHVNGIDDVNDYLYPDDYEIFDKPKDYPNVDKACNLFDFHVRCHNRIGVLVD